MTDKLKPIIRIDQDDVNHSHGNVATDVLVAVELERQRVASKIAWDAAALVEELRKQVTEELEVLEGTDFDVGRFFDACKASVLDLGELTSEGSDSQG